jgi:serine/threonine protein kinase
MEPDQTVAGYRLRNLLAAGQSSEVWEVVEQSSSRHLAMKTLLSSASKDAEQRRMLLHEADVGLKLAHPNIIRILNVSKDP